MAGGKGTCRRGACRRVGVGEKRIGGWALGEVSVPVSVSVGTLRREEKRVRVGVGRAGVSRSRFHRPGSQIDYENDNEHD